MRIKNIGGNIGNKPNWIPFIIFFIVFFISEDTFSFGTTNNFTPILFKYLIYFILTIFLLVKSNLKSFVILTKSSLVFYLIVFSVLLTAVFNFEFSGGYVYQIWLYLLGILIVNYVTYKDFITVYLKFIYTLSLISLIVFVIASISLSFFEIFPLQANSAGSSMYNLGVCVVFAGLEYVRNTSIFREPGVFMIYLNIAIILELFFKKEINKKNIFVFVIAIFSTFSTAAFITLAAIFIAYLFTKNTNISVLKTKSFLIITFVMAIVVLLSYSGLYDMVFSKIGKDNVGDGSSLARGVSVFANLNMFFDHYLVGVGIKNYPAAFGKYTLDLVGISMDVGNNTNTITTVFAVYGIFFGVLLFYMLFSLAKKTSNSFMVRIFLFLVLIMLYSNEDLRYSLMSATFLMWGMTSRKEIAI